MKAQMARPWSAASQAISVGRFVWSHPANRGRKCRQLANAMAFQAYARVTQRAVITPIGYRSRIYAELHQHAASKAVYAPIPDWPEFKAWERLLGRGDLFIDGGCNVGTYSIWAAEQGATVIAVEPHPESAAAAVRNAGLNGYPIEVVEAALGARSGVAGITADDGCENHLLPAGQGLPVQMVTLDEILDGRSARGVKLDLEGAEQPALEGARGALSEKRIFALQLEWNRLSETVCGEERAFTERYLSSLGYHLFRPDGAGMLHPCKGAAVGADVFAIAR